MITIYDFLEAYFGGEVPSRDWRGAISEERQNIGDEEFVLKMVYWTGGRSFNLFLDYGLMALKVKSLEEELNLYLEPVGNNHPPVRNIVDEYLWDDRHDIYQNVPYYLGEIKGQLPTKEWKVFIHRFADALLESFNPAGTGDISLHQAHDKNLR